MEISMVAQLASAGASIEAAMEITESGSPQWESLLLVRTQIETLVAHEVNGTWPEPEPESPF